MAQLKKLGRYELRSVLGKGAMGVVYEGFDPTLGRLVAVKTILKSAAFDEETERNYAARFSLEAKAVARLNHPNIIQVHDFGVENEAAYLVMEFIRGRELRSYFDANEKFDAAEAVRIIGELLDALEFAHEAGVIHRDVKPANVMLDAQRRVKLADFGVARIQDSDRSAAGTMVGTPAFMSPEQISGGKIDRRTDLFSAGVVLYQLLTGEQPFKGAGAWTVAKKIMQEDPPQPSSLVSNVSPAFDAVVERALAKAPAERFPNAREFAAALRGALGAAPAAAHKAEPPAAPKPKSVPRASEAELEFWRSIQSGGVAAEFEAYLQQFPEGTYAGLARVKLNTLRGPGAIAMPPQARTDDEATVAMPSQAPARPDGKGKRFFLAPALIVIAAALAGVVAFVASDRKSAPVAIVETAAPVPAAPAAQPKTEITPTDIEKIRKDTEERIRREYADKSASEQAAAAKVATEKAVQEKQLAAKAAAEKQAAARAAAEKAVVDKAMADKLAAARRSVEQADLERAAAEKAAAQKVAAEKAAAEKAAAERAAAEKLAAVKSASAGDDLLEKFIQRHGRDKVVKNEPPEVQGAMRTGEVVYINDGSCGPGMIRSVSESGGMSQATRSRTYRCISLKD